MTFWVTVKRGYALVISGTYYSADGLKSIETLLDRMSVVTEQ